MSTGGPEMSGLPALLHYDTACRALADAVRIDEVKNVHDVAVAMAAYARQAKNRDAEADAVEIRMRATRRLDQLRQAQKQTVGLAKGGEQYHSTGISQTPVVPTLAMQGIDKNLAKQARTLGALTEEKFETVIAEARKKVTNAVRNAVREVEISQRRASFHERIEHGCTIDDLVALAESGQRFGVIYADPPWRFETWGGDSGKIHSSADNHYNTQTLDEIMRLPVAQLAADDCALLLWCTGPHIAIGTHTKIIEAWGFRPSTKAFCWIKENQNGATRSNGQGYYTLANSEDVFLGIKGSPLRLNADVHQVVMAPVGEHSEKPDQVRRRIERLFPGPLLELYARKPAPRWTTWGNEIPRTEFSATAPREYDAADDFAKSYELALDTVRMRVAAGGPGWPQQKRCRHDERQAARGAEISHCRALVGKDCC
jgi:N6-adenosine-specific RNA methylase IME4